MIGERIRELRKSKKINQEELANIIGVQKSTVSSYEKNKIDTSDKVKIKIAKHFNISIDYLLGIVDEQVPYYTQETFFKLPTDFTKEERLLLSDYLSYIVYK